MGPGSKRKRPDRTSSYDGNDGSNRPSPYRPDRLNLAQQNHSQNGRGQGRGASGGGGGRGGQRGGYTSPSSNSQPTRPNPATVPIAADPSSNPASQMRAADGDAATNLKPAVVARPSRPASPTVEKLNLPPFEYEYLTDERVSSWQSGGKQATVDLVTRQGPGGDMVELSALFQEIGRSGLAGRIDVVDAGMTVKDILGKLSGDAEPADRFPSVFLDSFSVLADSLGAYVPSLKTFLVHTGVSPELVRQELDSRLLARMGMVRSAFDKMNARVTTNLLYRQSNYNLLREETEGYSKLMTELFTTGRTERPTSEAVEDAFERIKALIGAFDLDVGRSLDVTLDVFASVLIKDYHFFIKLLRASSWWPQDDDVCSTEAQDQGSEGLPKWALPGATGWTTTEVDQTAQMQYRERRDRQFWVRVREVGMDAWFELGGRRAVSEQDKMEMISHTTSDTSNADATRRWIEITHTLPPRGNRTAAQLLGFKLRFYASHARDESDVLPVNLIYLAALLIKVGFISLRDLYSHLYPEDEKMEEVREKQMKENADRERLKRPGGGTKNALAMAGALADDTVPAVPSRLREESKRGTPTIDEQNVDKPRTGEEKDEEKEKLAEPADQKVQMLRSLLLIGAVPEALFMLGRFPWLVDAFADLPECIHRILHHCLSRVSASTRPLSERSDVASAKPTPSEQGMPKGQLKLTDPPPQRSYVKRWALIDRRDHNDGTDYVFYWDDWADIIPVCQTVDEVFALCGSLLNISGVKIGQDPALLLKLARIGKKDLAEDTSKANQDRWIDLSKRLLIPALSMTKGNPGVVNEVFDLLKCFSTSVRYSIYSEWYNGATSRLPEMKAAFDLTRAETRDVLKRISKTNTKPMARALAKVAYASPGIVFSVALNQIESYDNLIEVVVECARYFTNLGYDVLTWSLLTSLSTSDRNRKQADGMLTSSWLKSLSTFAGKVFKRYSTMSPLPVLQYVANQLYKNQATDLEIMRRMLRSMAGIEHGVRSNDLQIQAMAGGPLLRSQTLLQLHDRRHELRKTSKRLMDSLTSSDLAAQLLVAIAQQRQTFIFQPNQANDPPKPLTENLDEIHYTLMQYLDVLQSNLPIATFNDIVPDIISLMSDYGLEPAIAFAVTRPSLAQAMAEMDAAAENARNEKPRRASSEKLAVNGDAEMVDPQESAETVKQSVEAPSKEDIAMSGVTEDKTQVKEPPQPTDVESPPTTTSNIDEPPEPWHPALLPLIDGLKSTLPSELTETMSLPFYVTFWQMSLVDIFVPAASYEAENARLLARITALNAEPYVSAAEKKKRDQERKALNETKDKLLEEQKAQINTQLKMRRGRLLREKNHWFTGFLGKWDVLNASLLQDCFLPRMMLSPLDAYYVFRMLHFLHSSGAPVFRTMHLIDRLIKDKQLTSLVFQCTQREAENLGRFLDELFQLLGRWHADKAVYEKEAWGAKKELAGFAKKMAANNTPEGLLEFEDYRRLLYKWHRNLNAALKACYTSKEYNHVRNAINVGLAMRQRFPAVNWIGNDQVKSLNELASDPRGDIAVSAKSLLGHLKHQESKWVLPQAFYINDAPQPKAGPRSESVKASTPQPQVALDKSSTPLPESAGKPLSATAADFKPSPTPVPGKIAEAHEPTNPKSTPDVNPQPHKAPEAKGDEIRGAKLAQARAKLKQAAATMNDAAKTEQRPQQQQEVSAPTPRPELWASTPARPTIPTAHLPNRTATPSGQAGTPKPSDTSIDSIQPASRPETGKLSQSVALPSRPPGRMPDHLDSGPPRPRPGDRLYDHLPSRRDDRPLPAQEFGRLDRPGDVSRSDGSEPRAEPSRVRGRSLQRYPEPENTRDRRDLNFESARDARLPPDDRMSRLPPRGSEPARSAQFERYPSESQQGGAGKLGYGTPLARPPASTLPSMTHPNVGSSQDQERGHLVNPDRARFLPKEHPRPEPQAALQIQRGPRHEDRGAINPERAALINGDDRIAPPRSGRSSRKSSRSPSRLDTRPLPTLPPSEDHYASRAPISNLYPDQSFPQSRREQYRDPHDNAPNGPRGDRSSRMNPPEHHRHSGTRELLQPSQPARSQIDPNHGRLSQDFSPPSHPQDINYGRLNLGSEAPSGPRAQNGMGPPGRNVPSATPATNRQEHIRYPTSVQSVATTPSGPANVNWRGRGSGQFDRGFPGSTPLSAPQTPSSELGPNVSGIHPSRREIVHSNASAALRPPPVQTSNMGEPASNPASPSPFAPAGPRGQRQVTDNTPVRPSVASPIDRVPSSGGSQSMNERRRFPGINDDYQNARPAPPSGTLFSGSSHQFQDRGASIRGRAGRQQANGSGHQPPQHSQPQTNPMPPSVTHMDYQQQQRRQPQQFQGHPMPSDTRQEFLPPRSGKGRYDLFSDKSGPSQQMATIDDRSSDSKRDEFRRDEDDGSRGDRSSRHNRSPDRARQCKPEERGGAHRAEEYHEQRRSERDGGGGRRRGDEGRVERRGRPELDEPPSRQPPQDLMTEGPPRGGGGGGGSGGDPRSRGGGVDRIGSERERGDDRGTNARDRRDDGPERKRMRAAEEHGPMASDTKRPRRIG